MIQETIDELLEYISKSGREDDVARVKQEYFRDAGGLFGEEESYNMRIGTFLEWYILDRRLGGKSILEEYAETVNDDDKRASLCELGSGIRSIFEVTSVHEDRIYLKDLGSGKKFSVLVPDHLKIFKNKNIVETRIFPYKKVYSLSGSYIFHPEKVKKFILSNMKRGFEMNDTDSVINMLATMSLKWEKYRNYRIEEIYKNKEG